MDTRRNIILTILLCGLGYAAVAQHIHMLASVAPYSFRGLSVVSDQVIWVSGSKGTVGKSEDGGLHWQWMAVPHYEQTDFRDIQAFSGSKAIIMGVTEPAVILRTEDGGKHWTKVFEDSSKAIFLDAMDFADDHLGAVIGDPAAGNMFVALTDDSGRTWSVQTAWAGQRRLAMADGEAFFAASGSNIKWIKRRDGAWEILAASGGKRSRLWRLPDKILCDSLPILQGGQTTGANALAILDNGHGIIVGGDFSHDQLPAGNCVLFTLMPDLTFQVPQQPPHGYRSSVCYISADRLVCCGTSGVDVSRDGGKTWTLISADSFHVCGKALSGNTVYLAGAHGRIARLEW